MRTYIINLTNHLIRKNHFDEVFHKISRTEFVKFVKNDLVVGDVHTMSPQKLGEIMCSFDIGDVLIGRTDLLEHTHFAGDCEELLRDLVSACLAYAILGRLDDPRETGIPSYHSNSDKLRTREVLDELERRSGKHS